MRGKPASIWQEQPNNDGSIPCKMMVANQAISIKRATKRSPAQVTFTCDDKFAEQLIAQSLFFGWISIRGLTLTWDYYPPQEKKG
jgi:hypothetical protein